MKLKKILSLLLASLCLTALLAPSAGAKTVTVPKYKNLALGKSYTTSGEILTGTAMPYQEVDGKELTDGKYGVDSYDTNWVCFDKRINNVSSHTVIVDLGEKQSGISRVSMNVRNAAGDGVGLPSYIEYSVSDDNSSYTALGRAKQVEETLNYSYEYVDSDAGISGRYFKAVIGVSSSAPFVFISEFEVCVNDGTQEIEVPDGEPEEIRLVGTSTLYIDSDGDLRGGSDKQTAEEFAKCFTGGLHNIKILKADGKERTSGYVSTGDAAVKYIDGVETDRAVIIIDGDVNGDGTVGAVDYAMVKRHYLGSYTLEGKFLKAGAVTNGTKIETVDYVKVKRHALATYDISVKYEREAMLYDKDMKFTKVSDVLYRMETTYEGKSVTLTFDKKSEFTEGSSVKNWGSWNIGTFSYDGKAIAGGGTDWEYVYRASDNQSGSWVWSGGNHGNELFLSLEIFNAETGEKLELSNGQSTTLKGLVLVEKTHLHWGDPNKYYAEVTRTYRVAGTKIELDVDYNYVRDGYFYQSYTCMFPVYKTYGRHSRIYDIDGSYHDNYTTDGTVYAEYGDHYDRGNKSLHVTFWGDSQPTWKFDVNVYTPYDSTDNFSNTSKTMVWDMNKVSDKLYVSKFESTKSTLIPAGSNLGTRSSWEFFVETEE